MQNKQTALAQLSQKIINYSYRHPLARYRYITRLGGYYKYYRMLAEQSRMIKMAQSLPPVHSYGDGLPIHFLTGKKYLYQTLFCIQSLVKVSPDKFRFILIDDGSFDENLKNIIQKKLPQAEIVTQQIVNKNLEQQLPLNLFPVLHRKRKEYPHIKKLTDVHTLPGKWKIVLDSDMLFWENPQEIISWLQNPEYPIYMYDCEQSYGYSETLMQSLCGSPIPNRVNVGVIGLNSENINWADIENWVNVLEQQQGTSYYLEQALSAMLIGNNKATILNPQAYTVNPVSNNQQGTLHHYVDRSKQWYYKKALQICAP